MRPSYIRRRVSLGALSGEYNRIRAVVDKQANGNPELRAHYEQIVDQVRQTKESTLQVDQRRFGAPVDKIEGTIKMQVIAFRRVRRRGSKIVRK